MAYDLYPAVDETYSFPPEVRRALAASTELRNTVVPMTTTVRDNLPPAERWDGRLIANTTTDHLEYYDSGKTAWTEVSYTNDSYKKSGWRNFYTYLVNGWTTTTTLETGFFYFARHGNNVEVSAFLKAPPTFSTIVASSLPAGFRASAHFVFPNSIVWTNTGSVLALSNYSVLPLSEGPSGVQLVANQLPGAATIVANTECGWSVRYLTDDAWPTVMPGTPAAPITTRIGPNNFER